MNSTILVQSILPDTTRINIRVCARNNSYTYIIVARGIVRVPTLWGFMASKQSSKHEISRAVYTQRFLRMYRFHVTSDFMLHFISCFKTFKMKCSSCHTTQPVASHAPSAKKFSLSAVGSAAHSSRNRDSPLGMMTPPTCPCSCVEMKHAAKMKMVNAQKQNF